MAFLLLRLLFGALILLATLVAAAAAAILAARVAPEPLAFLGAGLLVLVVGTAAAAFVATAGRSVSVVRRRLIAAASVVVAAVVVGALVIVPLGDPAVPPTPVPGMELADLPSGSRIAYVRVPGDPSGASSGDEPIVVLHGGPGVADMRNDLVFFRRLAADGREVILYDQVGSGHSGRLDDPTAYTLERDVADLGALLDLVGARRAVLVGHSYGGTLAAAFAAATPDRVAALAFLAPGAIRPHAVEYGTGMVDRLTPDRRRTLYAALLEPRALFGWLLTQANPRAARALFPDHEMDARYDRTYALSAPGLYCDPPPDPALPHGLGFYTNAVRRTIPDLRPALAGIHVPAIVLKPQCDYLPWTFGTDLVAALPDASLVYVEGAGHSLYAEKPDGVFGVLQAFLAGEASPIAPRTDLEPPANFTGPLGAG